MITRDRVTKPSRWSAMLAAGTLAAGLLPVVVEGAGIPLSDVAAGVGGFSMSGRGSFDYTGNEVAGAGDVNGDGIADLIVGARNASPGPPYTSGVTYVVFGKSTGNNVPLSSVYFGTGGFAIRGNFNGELSGDRVSTAGDVNGDGLCDIIVSRPTTELGDRAYVIFGKTSTGIVDLTNISSGIGGFAIGVGSSGFGIVGSVSGAGDVNGDGLADVIVGLPDAGLVGASSGVSCVVFGKASTTAVLIDGVVLGTGGFAIAGAASYDRSGVSVSAAGDVNGDGLADLVIGSSGGEASAKAHVVFGKSTTALLQLSSVNANLGGFRISDNNSGVCKVGGAGDVNGDGLADVVIGTPYYSQPSGLSNIGRAYVVFGKTSTSGVALSALQGANAGFVIQADSPSHAFLGQSVSGAGDINGDGLADVIIGQSEPLALPSQGSLSGHQRANGVVPAAAFVVFGKATSTPVSTSALDLSTGGFAIENETPGDLAGISVAGAGDVNGDGRADVVIGAPRNSATANNSGRAYVLFGTGPFAEFGNYSTFIRLGNAYIKGIGTHRFGADDTIFPDSRAWIDHVTGTGPGVGASSLDNVELIRNMTASVAGLPASAIADVRWDIGTNRQFTAPLSFDQPVRSTATVNTQLTFHVRYTNAEISGLNEGALVPYVSVGESPFGPSANFTRVPERNVMQVRLANSNVYPVSIILVDPSLLPTPTPTPTPSPTPSPSATPSPTPSPSPSPSPTPSPSPSATPRPSPTPTGTPVCGPPKLPFIKAAGLGVLIDSPDNAPHFVAYYVLINGQWIYQGDTGWLGAANTEIVFPQWPYPTLPLRLQGFRGDPAVGIPSLESLGHTNLYGRMESGWLTPLPTPMIYVRDRNGRLRRL